MTKTGHKGEIEYCDDKIWSAHTRQQSVGILSVQLFKQMRKQRTVNSVTLTEDIVFHCPCYVTLRTDQRPHSSVCSCLSGQKQIIDSSALTCWLSTNWTASAASSSASPAPPSLTINTPCVSTMKGPVRLMVGPQQIYRVIERNRTWSQHQTSKAIKHTYTYTIYLNTKRNIFFNILYNKFPCEIFLYTAKLLSKWNKCHLIFT